MKKHLIILALLAIAGYLYVLSYTSAHVRQVTPENKQDYRLSILGINLPYNPTTGKIFSAVYSPLIKRSASKIPRNEISGTIRRIDLSKSELMISRDTNTGILIHIPTSMTYSLGSFSEGESIRLTYSTRPMLEQPFCYYFQLSTIAHARN